jgi:tetratricopeptide (TPR) repeat protein
MAKKELETPKGINSPEQIHPALPAEFVLRGWFYYFQKDYSKADADYRRALQERPDDLDTVYALALNLKAMGHTQEAVESFQTVNLLADRLADKLRANIIKRISVGHINSMTQGNWNLEKEIWKRKA